MLINLEALSVKVVGGAAAFGSIWSSTLEPEHCPHCDTPNCNYSCDGSKAEYLDGSELELESEEEVLNRLKYNYSLDVIESLMLGILVHAVSKGLDIEALKPVLDSAIQTTLDKIGNDLG